MTFTPTNRPVPSDAPEDLYFNSSKLDEYVNSSDPTVVDRNGVTRKTWAGIEAETVTALSQLADPAPEKGAALISRGGQVVNSVAAIRLLSKSAPSKFCFATAHTAARQGLGGGAYWLDASDTTSTDDNGSVIVAADGGRWKLIVLGGVNVTCFGAVGDNTTENAAAFSAACAFAAGRPVIVPRTAFGNRYRATGFVAPLGTIFEYQGGGVVTSGDVNNATITYSGAGDAGEHRADTLTKGFGVEINQPLTGTGGANTYMLNRIFIRDDSLDAQTDAFPGTKVDGLILEHRFGGAQCRGGRHGFEVILTQTSPTAPDNGDENFVGAVSTVNGTTGDGGTALAPRGAYFAHNFYANLTNSMYTKHVNGCESNVLIDANSSSRYRSGYSAVSAGVKQGDETDAAYAIGALGVSGAEWKYGLFAGNQNGRNPLSGALVRDETTATTMLSAKVSKPVLYDTDDGRMRISLASSNYYTDNYTIRLGGIAGTANTPLFQFQCGSTDVNLYGGRVLASGGVPTTAGSGQIQLQFRQTLTRELAPATANTYTCGTALLPWSGGFTQSAFTVTSDERQKTDIGSIPDEVLDAWGEVEYLQFRLSERVAEKGDGARLHTGVIAQRVRDVLMAHGIDPHAYGVLCHDTWEAKDAEWMRWDAEYDDQGNLVREAGEELVSPAVEAGDLYTIRYQEADALSLAWLKRENSRKDAAMQILETRISKIEDVLMGLNK